MKEIAITEIENLKIGCAQDPEAATGCTVLLCEPVSYTHLTLPTKA